MNINIVARRRGDIDLSVRGGRVVHKAAYGTMAAKPDSPCTNASHRARLNKEALLIPCRYDPYEWEEEHGDAYDADELTWGWGGARSEAGESFVGHLEGVDTLESTFG